MINFRKYDLKHQKFQFYIGSKIYPKTMNLCMKHEIKCKRKGKKDLPTLGEENLAKRKDKNDKKLRLILDRVVWREKS